MRRITLALIVIASATAGAFIGGDISRQLHAPPATPATEPHYYSVHAFDLAGDGYPITVNVDLDKATCERQAEAGNNGPGEYLFVCREQ